MQLLRLFIHAGSQHRSYRIGDAGEWKEHEHPRNKQGEFAKSGGGAAPKPAAKFTVTKYVNQPIKAAGFKPAGSEGGAKVFEHPSGAKVLVHPPPEGQQYSSKWTSLKPGKTPISGVGGGIAQLLARSQSTPSQPPPASPLKAKAAPKPKPKPPASLPAAGQTAIGAPVELGQMKLVGPALGSNPGGVFEAPDGAKFYVKRTKSGAHAQNEMLAAALFHAAGGDTLEYHPAKDDHTAVVTAWREPDKAGGVNSFTAEEKKAAAANFATHAWLANWDAVGLKGDNMAVMQGKPVALDFGGSLLFRAQGASKGAAFGDSVEELDTLRDPAKNAAAAGLFGQMTDKEIEASAAKVFALHPDKIRELVDKHGPGDPAGKKQLADKLIARREDLAQRVGQLGKPQVAKYLHQPSTFPAQYQEHIKSAPAATPAEAKAITTYSGSSYVSLNGQLRDSYGEASNPTIEALRGWLAKASLPEQINVTRKLNDDFGKKLTTVIEPGVEFVDHGFASSDHWTGTVTCKITLPKGAQAAPIGQYSSNPHEHEILIQAGSRYHVDTFDPKTKTMHLTLVRSGRAGEGTVHKK